MICLVTDRRRLGDDPQAADRLVDMVAAAARAGVELIQIRERDLETRDLVSLVRRCVEAAQGTAAKVLVNDRVDVALASGAHGVHLRSDSIDAPAARQILPAGALIGRSVHGAEEASAVSALGGVDYLILGTMFSTESKHPAHPRLSLDELMTACGVVSIPILAIGGMTVERTPAIVRAGAAGIAAIRLFVPPVDKPLSQHIQSVVSQLRRAFDTCGAVP
jgi:thiamine-phosphate pyrophosphorylase